jgi:hypothetical protein
MTLFCSHRCFIGIGLTLLNILFSILNFSSVISRFKLLNHRSKHFFNERVLIWTVTLIIVSKALSFLIFLLSKLQSCHFSSSSMSIGSNEEWPSNISGKSSRCSWLRYLVHKISFLPDKLIIVV